jgi:hypothetical protein
LLINDTVLPPVDYKGFTDNQLLLAIVPDFEVRLIKLSKENSEFTNVLNTRVQSENGWRPLHYLQGFD